MDPKTNKEPIKLLLSGTSNHLVTLRAFVDRLRQHITPKRVTFGVVGILLATFAVLTIYFYWPKTVTFSYARATCFTNPVLLPGLSSVQPSRTFKAVLSKNLVVAGRSLYSSTTCIMPTAPPTAKTSEIVMLGSILKEQVKVAPAPLPKIQNPSVRPISTKDPLIFTLNTPDIVFDYQLAADGKKANCTKHNTSLICDVPKLSLAQSTTYTFTLERLFNSQPAQTILQKSLVTVEPVRIVSTSITAGQTIYSIPTDLSISLSKPAESFKNAHLYLINGNAKQDIPITTNLNDKTLIVHFTQPLARSASFVLSIDDITAPDGGYLNTPLSLSFQTSGGPKVLSVNIGSYKVPTTASVVINFDNPVSTTQAIGNFVRLEAGGSTIATTVSTRGATVILTPKSALGRCTALTVRVLDGLQNEFGISGGSAWQYKSRTICQAVFSIGASVQGRSVLAYSFGGGASKVIFVGTTHGDEKSSTYTLNSWIDYLEANALSVPASRTVIVIPDLNPDGFAANTRTNAHHVDLNRNFPANDWKSDVTMPDGSFNPGGGGSAPLSEPESSALASYVLGQSPRLVLTYHAVAGVVVPNYSGDSVSLAQTYDSKSNLYFASDSQADALFTYDTTGSFETWLHDKPGITALLIELWTHSSNEFSKNQSAMWTMIQTP